MKHTARPKIVIVGGGFGGIELARSLKKAPVDVVLIDKHNYHTFQPLLYQVAIGAIEADSVGFPIRRIFTKQNNFKFLLTEVVRICLIKITYPNTVFVNYPFLLQFLKLLLLLPGLLYHFAKADASLISATNVTAVLTCNLFIPKTSRDQHSIRHKGNNFSSCNYV